MSALPRLLTIDEVADALRVSYRTVQRRISDGSLAATRIGGVLRIPEGELERFVLAGVDRVEERKP